MNISYQRSGGRRPPRDNESLQITDARFTMWRSVGAATYPATAIGHFAGTLPPDVREALGQEAAGAAGAGNLTLTPKPDGALETITVDSVRASLGANDDPAGPWQPLITHLRQLLGDLTAQPRAAIAAHVEPDGTSARLVHLGTEPLRLDLTSLSVRAVLWQDYTTRGDWRAPNAGRPGETTAAPGWSLGLPFDHGFTIPEGTGVRVYVTFGAFNDAVLVPVSVEG
ncbi:MAG TPA: hypothetical protein VN837_16785 [Chloroflexota bacterium]|nr:hypothetical protein [Chloroflexota bacterium]